jgi:hypothetical protein
MLAEYYHMVIHALCVVESYVQVIIDEINLNYYKTQPQSHFQQTVIII